MHDENNQSDDSNWNNDQPQHGSPHLHSPGSNEPFDFEKFHQPCAPSINLIPYIIQPVQHEYLSALLIHFK